MQPFNRHSRICPASKYRLGLRHGCKTGGNRLFDTVADRDIGRVKLARPAKNILAGRFVSSEQKILRRDYSSYSREPDKIHYLPVRSDCIDPNTATAQQPNT